MLEPQRKLNNISSITIQFLFVFFNLFGFSPTLADTNQHFNLTEVSSGIFVHKGKHVSFDHVEHDDIANIGFIVGDKCIAVIDTGGSAEIGRLLFDAIESSSRKPVCYVINTHIHIDHILGNSIFDSSAVKFIGHKELANEIATNREFFSQQTAHHNNGPENIKSIREPDIRVHDKLEIDLGNRVLSLRSYESAHSHTDLSVFDQRSKTLWLSDLLFIECIPSLDGNLIGWLGVLEIIKVFAAEIIIPGHGSMSTKPHTAMDLQQRYLEMLLSQTRQKIAEGLFMEDIIDIVGAGEAHNWKLFEQHHKRNVSKTFTELEWE